MKDVVTKTMSDDPDLSKEQTTSSCSFREFDEDEVSVRVLDSIGDLSSAEWDACLQGSGVPFMRYSFLHGLELHGCVGPSTGWLPRYLILKVKGILVAALACYRKNHSQGEFIFDWSWADAAHRIGIPYYPKLTIMSPFSPIGGPKLIINPNFAHSLKQAKQIKRRLLQELRKLAESELVTGIHLLFIDQEEEQIAEQEGLLTRHTLQFQWRNEGYQSFEDFLGRFRSKRRNQIKRERRRVHEAGVSVSAYIGSEIQPEHIPIIYRLYRSTVEKYFFGNLYLTPQFFQHLYDNQRDDLCLILAERDGEILGGSFNLQHDGVLYGRYWGCEPEIEIDSLHFEVCAYRGIELCIDKGWKRFEAGAGGGGHKFGRGFLPRVIYSAHEVYLPGFTEALSLHLAEEKSDIARQLDACQDDVLKPKAAQMNVEK